MNFTGFAREVGKKGALNEARREGKIPAVLYGPKKENSPLYLKKEEFEAVLRKMAPNTLATTIFELDVEGKKRKVLIKEVQYGRASYAVEHVDFFEVVENLPLQVNVPIQIAGIMDCAGVKLGGFVRQVIRHLKVSCLPKEIPQHFILDVREMQLAEVKRLSDLPLPKGVKPLAKMNEVAVVIAKKV
ncbi:MAG TPA: 50S ribosomal protein L25 [Chlamydiales bacterium]|nr:50S ribosomal protein L25 [Chlamydiales bacterium]